MTFNKIRMMFSREDSSFYPRYLFIADERVTILRFSERVYLVRERERVRELSARISPTRNSQYSLIYQHPISL